MNTSEREELLRAPSSEPVEATITNPWTGEPRDYRDVESDPRGVLCVEPGAPLEAAQDLEGLTVKQAWWAGYRAGKSQPPETPRHAALAHQPAPVVDAACNWRQQDEDGDHISTGCGHEFILNDSGDYEDGRPVFSFCCFCSKPTMFHRWRDEPECSCDHSDGDAPECEGCADRRNRAALARAQGVQS